MDTGKKDASAWKSTAGLKTWLFVIVLAFLVTSSGCNPKSTKLDPMEGIQVEWADMDISQRKGHMAQVILPIAASVFQTWRLERYAEVNCTLCHGPGFQAENFHMPTTHLPRLSGDLLLGTEFRSQPETTRLKLNRLVPEMAEALDKQPFSIITRRGFGCYSCHLGPTGPMFGN